AAAMRMKVAVAIKAPIGDEEINAALNRMIAAQEAFRMGFHVDGEPAHIGAFLLESAATSLVSRRAAPSSSVARDYLLKEAMAELMNEAIPLDEPPLLRALVYRFGPA